LLPAPITTDVLSTCTPLGLLEITTPFRNQAAGIGFPEAPTSNEAPIA